MSEIADVSYEEKQMSDGHIVKMVLILAAATCLLAAAIVVPVAIYSHVSQQTQVRRIAACKTLAPAAQVLCIQNVTG